MPAARTAVYNREQLTRYKNVSAQGEVATTDTGDIPVIVMTNAKFQVVVKSIILNVYTSAAQAFQFESDGAGGDPVLSKAASPALGEHRIDWGELGYALPAGEGLHIALGGTGGNAFTFLVEAYVATLPNTSMTPAQMTAG